MQHTYKNVIQKMSIESSLNLLYLSAKKKDVMKRALNKLQLLDLFVRGEK